MFKFADLFNPLEAGYDFIGFYSGRNVRSLACAALHKSTVKPTPVYVASTVSRLPVDT